MAKAEVLFITARTTKYNYESSLIARFDYALEQFNLRRFFSSGQIIPIKLHLGSRGATPIIRPIYIKKVIDKLKMIGVKPFVTDSARINAYDYLMVANYEGYNQSTFSVPVVIADGIYGMDSVTVEAGEILGRVQVPSAIYDAPAMVVMSHCKGHVGAGFGGAIKNIAMGGVSLKSRTGNWESCRGKAHFLLETKVFWDKNKCTQCLTCVNICPLENAISFIENNIIINDTKCWRCGRCIRVCPSGALYTPGDDQLFQKALAEQALAVLSTFDKGKIVYINILLDILPECDCMDTADVPVVQDIGILISDDPVAIDWASLDLINKQKPLPASQAEGITLLPDKDIFSVLHQKNSRGHMEFLANKGGGNKEYILKKF